MKYLESTRDIKNIFFLTQDIKNIIETFFLMIIIIPYWDF